MEELTRLVKNISIYTVGNIINKSLGFILIPIYSIYLTTEDYGIISGMTLFMSVTTIIITLSLDRAVYRCYFDYENEEDRKIFLGTIIISLFFITSLFIIVIITFSNYVGLIFKSIPFYPYYFLTLSILFISTVYHITIIYFRITEQSKRFVFLSISYFLLNVSLIIYFVTHLKSGADGKLTANLLANIIILPIAFIIIKNNVIFRFDLNMLKNALAYCLPIIPTLMSGFVLNMSDRIFVEKVIDLHSLGIYSMGYQLAGALTIISSSFYGAYNPMFLRIVNFEKEKLNYLKIIQDKYHITIIALHFLVFFFAKDFFILLIDPKFLESYKIFQLIIIANLFNGLFDIVGLSFSQDKKMKTLMYIVVSGAIVNVILNYYFVPIYGMNGACYTTIISFLIIGITKYLVARNYFFIPWNWLSIGLFVFIIIIIYGFSILLSFNDYISNIIFKLFLSFSLISFYIFKVKISVKNILQKNS